MGLSNITKFLHTAISEGVLLLYPKRNVSDLAIVLPPNNSSGWILDRICHEIGSRFPQSKSLKLIRSDEPLIVAKNYFFSHYMYFIQAIDKGNLFKNSKIHIFFTHLEPEKHGISNSDLMKYLVKADIIICMNSLSKDNLINLGINSKKIFVVIGGADETFFFPKNSDEKKYIGFVSAYYPRKNPNMIQSIISKMPNKDFLLRGKNCEQYHHFKDLIALPNLTYICCKYDEYPDYYRSMQVLISPSNLEGGPIPIIEAMLSNTPVIASNSGFAPDIITEGKNGYLFSTDSTADDVIALIKKIPALQKNIRETVYQYTWANFSKNIRELLKI